MIISSDRKMCHDQKQISLIAHWLFPMSTWNLPSWYFYLITSSALWHLWKQIVFFFYTCPSNIWKHIFLKQPFVVPVILLCCCFCCICSTSLHLKWSGLILFCFHLHLQMFLLSQRSQDWTWYSRCCTSSKEVIEMITFLSQLAYGVIIN